MMRKLLYLFSLTICPLIAAAQDTYLPLGSPAYHLLDRLETKSGAFSNDLFTTMKGVNRRSAYRFLRDAKSVSYYSALTNVDEFNINQKMSLSGEWQLPDGNGALNARHPWFHTFYNKAADFVHINNRGFFLVINPILALEGISEKDGKRPFVWKTSQGIELRGRALRRLGFALSVTNNYLELPDYQERRRQQLGTVPNAPYFRENGNGYQFLRVRGHLNVALIDDHVSAEVGYGQHFIGDGMRSLFLSDFAEGAFYAAINTRIWRLNYQNLYLRLIPQSFPGEPPTTGYKYATVHHLSLNLRPWLNIGLFESVTFARDGGFEIGYMNPVIFYRAIERSMGSPDKVAIGLNAKAIAFKRFNFYGQFLLNEFTAKEFFGNNGYWANKWGLQLGVKYYDVFSLPNLDFQAEVNLVRPYTYTHSRRVETQALANYSHFNQPLAHPLGAGFRELNLAFRYQPIDRLVINARAMYYQQGTDTAGANLGNNILRDYRTRAGNYGVSMVNGPATDCMMLGLNLSYELRPRLYIDLGGDYRYEQPGIAAEGTRQDLFFRAGFRLNFERANWKTWY